MRRAVLTCLVAVAGALLAGCSGGDEPSPSVPTFSTTTPPSKPPTSTTPAQALPGDCRSVLPTSQIDMVLGKPLVGKTSSIVGVPEPKIRRLERLTCRYGLPAKPPKKPTPIPLEISISRYADETSATERVGVTVEGLRASGAAPSTVQVGPVEGTILVSDDERLLVAVDGTLTLAISMAPKVADDRLEDVLAELGGRVLTALTT